MTENPYILFHKSLDQCRQLGARGGRVQARNRRLRQLEESQAAATPAFPEPELETAAQAIAALDEQFPWLRGVEKRKIQRRFSTTVLSPELGSNSAANCAVN